MSAQEGPVGIRVESLLKRLSPPVQKAIDGQFAKAVDTTFEVAGEERECLYLAKVVASGDDGQLSQTDVDRFSRLMDHLISTGMVGHAVLADPIAIPMTHHRHMMLWYVFSDYTREELNTKLGCDCFVEEGGLYKGPWPSIVSD